MEYKPFFFLPKCNSTQEVFLKFYPFVQNLNYCTLRYTKLVWGTTRWITRTALKGLTHGINSLITHTGPATSVKVTNTASLYKLCISRFDAFNIWWRSSVLISEFPLHCDRWFYFVIPQNTLGFLLHWSHFNTSRLCNCNITINTWHKILETNQGKTLCSPCIIEELLLLVGTFLLIAAVVYPAIGIQVMTWSSCPTKWLSICCTYRQ